MVNLSSETITANLSSETITAADFVPTNRAREARAVFQTHMEKSPLLDPEKLTLEQVKRMCGWPKIEEVINVPGCKEWFFNSTEFTARMRYMSDLAADQLQEILLDPDTNTRDKLNAIKSIMELANRVPKAKEVVYADKQISEMSKAQLDSYIDKHKALLVGDS